MKSPAFQFYPAEFLSDENVALMSNRELGCYMKLMCYCWREGSIPSDISKIAKLCGEINEDMAQLWLAISSCFELAINDLTRQVQPRLEKERLKQLEHRKERSESGTKGAKAKWDKASKVDSSATAKPIAEPIANDGSLSSTSSSTPLIKESKKKARSQLSDNFIPTQIHQDFARLNHLDIPHELKKFRFHHESKITLSGNWNSSFSTWLTNAIEFRKPIQSQNVQEARLDVARQIFGGTNGTHRPIIDVTPGRSIESDGAGIPKALPGVRQSDAG